MRQGQGKGEETLNRIGEVFGCAEGPLLPAEQSPPGGGTVELILAVGVAIEGGGGDARGVGDVGEARLLVAEFTEEGNGGVEDGIFPGRTFHGMKYKETEVNKLIFYSLFYILSRQCQEKYEKRRCPPASRYKGKKHRRGFDGVLSPREKRMMYRTARSTRSLRKKAECDIRTPLGSV